MSTQPVIIVGAGPIGLTTALALSYYRIPFLIFEREAELSREGKAGTTLTRTIEAFRRYGVADAVLSQALRLDELGEIERATNRPAGSIKTAALCDDTRYPFVLNIPQNEMEPILAAAIMRSAYGSLAMRHQLVSFTQTEAGVSAQFETPDGARTVDGSYLLACDGSRSSVRQMLGNPIEGFSLDVRYMLVELKLDLDPANPRDYPYLSYFSDPQEWIILARQPHGWRLLYPVAKGAEPPTQDELREKVLRFIGEVDDVEVLSTAAYNVHHRIAQKWRSGRVFLMGDAAHLITPMWALGLNTGILDTISLPWRLAWVLRGWAKADLLDGYEREQRPVAAQGSGEMAEAARKRMGTGGHGRDATSESEWADACTRTLLGVRVDTDGSGDWSMIRSGAAPTPLRVGERMPDYTLHGPDGRPFRLHDLVDGNFLALYFTDVRRRLYIPPNTSPALHHFAVSRWDVPLDSGLRDRCLLDVGERLRLRLGVQLDTLVLVRPDDHVAAIVPIAAGRAEAIYHSIVGMPPARAASL